jgi:hypothetical protein
MRMSRKEWRKLDVVERIGRGELTIAEAARALGISTTRPAEGLWTVPAHSPCYYPEFLRTRSGPERRKSVTG